MADQLKHRDELSHRIFLLKVIWMWQKRSFGEDEKDDSNKLKIMYRIIYELD